MPRGQFTCARSGRLVAVRNETERSGGRFRGREPEMWPGADAGGGESGRDSYGGIEDGPATRYRCSIIAVARIFEVLSEISTRCREREAREHPVRDGVCVRRFRPLLTVGGMLGTALRDFRANSEEFSLRSLRRAARTQRRPSQVSATIEAVVRREVAQVRNPREVFALGRRARDGK